MLSIIIPVYNEEKMLLEKCGKFSCLVQVIKRSKS